MQENKPGSKENDQQADYNPTARNFDQGDVTGPSQPINDVNQERAETAQSPAGNGPATKEDTEVSGESPREANWAPPEEEGRNENNRNEGMPNAPTE